MRMPSDAGFQQADPLTAYPLHRVVGVINSLQEAKQAVHALQDAGFSGEDIHLIQSQDFIAGVQEWKQQRSPLVQVVEIFLASYDEGFPGETYLHEAEQGHAIRSVRLSMSEQVNHVRDILANYHAHQIKYFGRWAITDLPL
jgi:hypothetical protein